MKILHTSDWHLGKKLGDFLRIAEQQAILEEIVQIADREKVDAVFVAGDLFDTYNPPTWAIDLLYKTLKKLSSNGERLVIAIAGNHDSPDRISAPDPLARECGIIFAGYPNVLVPDFMLESGLKVLRSREGFAEFRLPNVPEPLRLLLTPYASEFRLKTCLGQEDSEEELRLLLQKRWQELADCYCDKNGVNMLISHLFFVKRGDEFPEEPEEEKPVLHVGGAQAVFTENIPSQLQYAALGHLHRMHRVAAVPCPVYYSGSPLSYSFAEAGQKKYVILIDALPGQEADIREIELNSGKILLRKRAEGISEALQWLKNHADCLVELTIVTDTFLTANDRKLMLQAHPGIVTIIPEVKNKDLLMAGSERKIDLSLGIEDLFRDYFRHAKGQEPNAEIIGLFNEALSEEAEEF